MAGPWPQLTHLQNGEGDTPSPQEGQTVWFFEGPFTQRAAHGPCGLRDQGSLPVRLGRGADVEIDRAGWARPEPVGEGQRQE